jgi:hypothetical protein
VQAIALFRTECCVPVVRSCNCSRFVSPRGHGWGFSRGPRFRGFGNDGRADVNCVSCKGGGAPWAPHSEKAEEFCDGDKCLHGRLPVTYGRRPDRCLKRIVLIAKNGCFGFQ